MADIEEDIKIIGIKERRNKVRKEQNGKESRRRLKPRGGCNVSERRRRIYIYIYVEKKER